MSNMAIGGIVILFVLLFAAIAVIAGLCFLGYFLYKKHEEKKENKNYEE